jgi:hypothetical protein
MANDRYWPRTVVIDVLFSFNLAATPSWINSISFSAYSNPIIQLLGDGLLIKGYAANITLAFITHQYNGAANHGAPLQWCCRHPNKFSVNIS